MASKENLLKMLSMQLGPQRLQELANRATQSIMSKMRGVSPEAIAQIIKILEYIMDNPEQYEAVLQKAMAAGALQPGIMPPRFDPLKIGLILLALYGVQSQMRGQAPQAFKKGGLALAAKQLAAKGRNGDTMLAHITPVEAAMLKRAGGSGTINPETGLPEFFLDFLGDIFGNIGNLFGSAMDSIGSVIGVSGDLVGDVVQGAVTGAATSAVTGGNPLVGAITGGLGASPIATQLGDWAGGAFGGIGGDLVKNIGAQNFGAGLIGAAGGALTGENPLLTGLMTGGQTAALNSMGMLTPQSGLEQVAAGNLGPGINLGSAGGPGVDLGAATPTTFTGDASWLNGSLQPSENIAAPAANSAGSFAMKDWLKLGTLGLSAMALFGNMSPAQAQQAIQRSPQLTDSQKAALNRPLTQYSASWGDVYAPPKQGEQGYADYQDKLARGQEIRWVNPTLTQMSHGGAYKTGGGALSQLSQLVEGAGSGRDDAINAQLSDGEYVMDAESVALLGDGSTKEGANRLDAMRVQLRKHKGKQMSKGKFSSNAKSPLAYMKGGMK